jgi:hypothetical protein
MEKNGLKAGLDPLKSNEAQSSVSQKNNLPPEVQKIYQDIANYCIKLQIIDKLCLDLATKDVKKTGMVNELDIQQVFKNQKMPINKK